jgi:hypothetical protein
VSSFLIRRAEKLAKTPKAIPSEWDFLPRFRNDPRPKEEVVLPKNERKFCDLYEFSRTACRLPGATLLEDVLKWRSQAGSNQFDDLIKVAAEIQDRVIWRLLVAFPEWPENAWLSIPQKERIRRLKTLFPKYYPALSTDLRAKDVLPATEPPEAQKAKFWRNFKERGMASIPVGKGFWTQTEVDWMEDNHYEIDWSEAGLKEGEPIERYIIGLLFDLRLEKQSVKDSACAFIDQLWEQRKELPRETSRGKRSSDYECGINLKYLGAYRLLEVMSWEVAAYVTEKRLGIPLFSEESEWNEARHHAAQILEAFRQLKRFYSTDT